MAAPPKPWELQRNSTVPVYDNQSRGSALASSAAAPTGDTTQIGNPRPAFATANNPPDIPPRITTRNFGSGYGISPYRQMGGYGGYNTSYGYGSTGLGYGSTGLGYGSTGYGYGSAGLGYGSTGLGYGSYGGYGSGLGSYGYGNSFGYGGAGNDIESRFVQLAEESSRPAFQTIESVVRAFASIAGMMDSTFFAITSSFRAILGVAENFGRLRTLFSQMWTSFAVFRMFNWILKKLLSLIGIRTAGQANDAWSEAISSQAVGQGAAVLNDSRPSGWPVVMFLGVILSAPYVISRLFSNTIQETQNQPPPGYRRGKAIHNFVARSQNEINLSAGQIVWIAPSQIQVNYSLQNTGWIFVQNSNGQSGIVPINHIAVYNQAPKNPVAPQPSTSKEENVEKPSDISDLEPSIK